jgi:hypothetical protein
MDELIGKLDMCVLADGERLLLTSTLRSGALLLEAEEATEVRDDATEVRDDATEDPDSPDSQEEQEELAHSGSALVKRLEAELKAKTDELRRERRLSECLGLLRTIDWSSLSEGDWYFAADALTAGCRSQLAGSRGNAATT